MDENEFEYEGVMYTSKESAPDCAGCAFIDDATKCISSPDCRRSVRDDGRNVIFVEKHP